MPLIGALITTGAFAGAAAAYYKTKGTHVILINKSRSNTHIKCVGANDRQFQGKGTPKKVFTGQKINAGAQSPTYRLEIYIAVNFCHYWTLELKFDGKCETKCRDVISFNQRAAYDKKVEPEFQHYSEGHHDIITKFDTDSCTVTITVENNQDYVISAVQKNVDREKKKHQYNDAKKTIRDELKSSLAKRSKYVRQALERMMENVVQNEKAYNLLCEAKKLGAKDTDEALGKLQEARTFATDDDLLREISNEEKVRIEQKMDATAQDFLKEADESVNQNNYEEAWERSVDAERYAQSDELRSKIYKKKKQVQECIDMERAKALQAEGIKAIEQKDFEGARVKYQLALNYTVDRKLKDSLLADIDKSYDMQATLFKQKAAALVEQGDTNGAIELYEKALAFAKDIKLIKNIKEDMEAIGDKFAEKLQNEGNNLIKQNDFIRGLDRLLMAKTYSKELALIQSIEDDIQTAYNNEAMRIQNEANNLVKQGKHETAVRLFDEALIFARDLQTNKSILLDKANTLRKCMELAQESGQKLASQNNFQAALAKYSEAEELAVDEEALMSIIKDKSNTLDMQNEILQKQTKEMIREKQFNEGKIILNEAIKHTADSILVASIIKYKTDISTKQTDFLQKEANKLADQNKFEDAIKLIDQALTVAGNFKRTQSINTDKAKILNRQGLRLLEEAVDYESSHDVEKTEIAERVKKYYADAEKLYLEALKLDPSKEIRTNLISVMYKIEGNRYMKEAGELDKKACQLYNASKKSETFDELNEAQNKCKDAAKLYEQAEISFKQAAKSNKKFKASDATNASNRKRTVTTMSTTIASLRADNNKQLALEKYNSSVEKKIEEYKRKKELDAADVDETYKQQI